MRFFATTVVGIPQGLLIALAIVMVLIALFAIIDAARRPEAAFVKAGQKKSTWLLILILTALFCGPVGTVINLYYLFGIRPQVDAAA